MKMKKIVAAVTATALLMLSVSAFVGCSKSDEDVIREALTEELEGIKNQDDAYMSQMAADLSADEFAVYGIDATEFMSEYLAGFDYSIDSITVTEDSAEAVVTLTCKSFSKYEDAIEAETYNAIENTDIASMTDDEINMLVGQIMMTALKNVEVAPTSPITIEYTKVDNVWEPSTSSSNAITNAMLTN